MINLDKVRIYKKLGGDLDQWNRSSKASIFRAMTDQDWFSIDSIIQTLSITENGLATPEFTEQTRKKLNDLTENDEVRTMLIAMAKAPPRR